MHRKRAAKDLEIPPHLLKSPVNLRVADPKPGGKGEGGKLLSIIVKYENVVEDVEKKPNRPLAACQDW